MSSAGGGGLQRGAGGRQSPAAHVGGGTHIPVSWGTTLFLLQLNCEAIVGTIFDSHLQPAGPLSF